MTPPKSSLNDPSADPNAWYEQYPTLSRALNFLKPLPDYVQELVGKKLYAYAKELAYGDYEAHVSEEESSTQGLKRFRQFMQNKAHHSMVSRALNEVMSLNEQGRSLVGQRLLLCLQALNNLASQYPSGDDFTSTKQSRIEVHTLINLVFDKNLSDFELQGQQRKAERKALLEEEKLAEAMLNQALEQVGEIEDPFIPNNPAIKDETLQRMELDPEMTRLASLQETVPTALIPTIKRMGRFLVLWVTPPEEVVNKAETETVEDVPFKSLDATAQKTSENVSHAEEENKDSEELFESLDQTTVEIVHTENTHLKEGEEPMNKAVFRETPAKPQLQTTPEEPVLGPFELSEAERLALIEEVTHPSKTVQAEEKVNNILSLLDSGVDVDAIPQDASPEEKLARGLALFNNSDPPLIKPNRRDLALTEAEIDLLIARVAEDPKVRAAKEQAKQKVLDALAFMNDIEKPALNAEGTFQQALPIQGKVALKKPYKPRAKQSTVAVTPQKAEKVETLAKGLTKSSTEAKPATASKRSGKTTAVRKKTTDASKE
jgi:hypothetical protein